MELCFGYFQIINMELNNSFLNESNLSVAVVSNVSNILDVDEYIAQLLGSRYNNSPSLGILTSIYCLIFLTGIVGNGCTCIVIAKNKYMQTATNYYLFSLAVSDLLTLILALPPELYSFWESYPWRFGEGFCIMKSFISEMTAYASVLTITAFTIERYAAICHPMRFQTLSSLSRAAKIIVLIWIIACLSALPYPLHARTFYAVHFPNTTQPIDKSLVCNIPVYWRDRMKYVFQISTFVFFVAPMTIITVMYLLIGITLYKSENFGNPNTKNGKKKTSYVSSWGTSNKDKNKTDKNLKVPFNVTKARKAVLKMLVAVVIAFFACWAPFHSQRLMTIYMTEDQWTMELIEIQTYLFYVSGALYFFSATINPILYNVMSKKYRKAFKWTMCRCFIKDSYEPNISFFGSTSPKVPKKFVNCSYSKIPWKNRSKITLTEKMASMADIPV